MAVVLSRVETTVIDNSNDILLVFLCEHAVMSHHRVVDMTEIRHAIWIADDHT